MDGITNEMLKYGGRNIQQEITTLFNKIMNDGLVPQEWKTSKTTPIFKRGSKKDPNNYRSITLLSSVLKILTKIVAEEITKEVDISEEQQGITGQLRMPYLF